MLFSSFQLLKAFDGEEKGQHRSLEIEVHIWAANLLHMQTLAQMCSYTNAH